MKAKDWILELAMPVVMFILGVYFYMAAGKIKPASAGRFPKICAIIMFVGCIITVFEIIRRKEKTVHFENVKWWKALLIAAILLVYAVLLTKIGYLIDTFLLSGSIMLLLGYKKIHWVVICAAIGTLAVFVLFKVILNVPLPLIWLKL